MENHLKRFKCPTKPSSETLFVQNHAFHRCYIGAPTVTSDFGSKRACHRKYSQSGCRKAVVYSSVLHRISSSISGIQPYHTQPSHVAVFSIAWYKKLCNRFTWKNRGICHSPLVLSWYTQSPKGSCVYQKIQVAREIFYGIPLDSVA